ncbi:MAG: hypothetical protein AMXMBFR13_18220 [Phycisphaerae bacterium]
MILVDFLFAFLVALILSSLIMGLTGWGGLGRTEAAGLSWVAALFIFFILLAASWAGGIWLTPFGPILWGVYWLPFLLVGLIVALLIGSMAAPARRPRFAGGAVVPEAVDVEHREENRTERVISGVFWVLLVILAAAILARYLWV